jgi:hypothetical protein
VQFPQVLSEAQQILKGQVRGRILVMIPKWANVGTGHYGK